MFDKLKEYAGIITIVISIISSFVAGIAWIEDKLQQENKELECLLLQNVALVQNQIPMSNWEIEIVKQQVLLEKNQRKLAESANRPENDAFIKDAIADIDAANESIRDFKDKKKIYANAITKIEQDIKMRNCREYQL